jgi:toxin ParE1/3/4
MMPVSFTPEARADLRDIALRIADHNLSRAFTYVDEIEAHCLRIGDLPHAWPPRPQWGEGVRITIHGNYVIVHRVRDETVQVLRLVHGARDLDALFEDEPLPAE